MSIPIGQNFTCTVTGKVVKNVICIRCNCEYVYIMQREVSGEGTSLLWADNQGAKATNSMNVSIVTPSAVSISSSRIGNGRFQIAYAGDSDLRYVLERASAHP